MYPKKSQDPELAESFITFLLSEEIAVANAEYIYCSIPNSLVYENEQYKENMGEEIINMLYPEIDDFSQQFNKYAYRNLSQDLLDNLNSLWETVKIN